VNDGSTDSAQVAEQAGAKVVLILIQKEMVQQLKQGHEMQQVILLFYGCRWAT
jgi:hypothetical protein